MCWDMTSLARMMLAPLERWARCSTAPLVAWLSFLAIIMYVQQAYGSAASAVVFLVQTVPALLAARSVSDRIPSRAARKYWVWGHLVLSAMTAALALTHTLFASVLAYVALSMLLKAILSPLYMSLIAGSVPQEQRRSTMTGVGAAGSIAIVIAPALGGLLLSTVGPGWLFAVNAATYALVAVIMLARQQIRSPEAAQAGADQGSQAGQPVEPPAPRSPWSSLPSPRSLLFGPGSGGRFVLKDPVLATWVLLLLVGALLNGMETPFSFDVLGVTQAEFGWILSCFGLGGLLVLILSSVRDEPFIGPRWAVVMYAGGLAAWMVAGPVGAYLGFFVAGMGGALISGWTRAQLDLWSESRGVRAQLMWGWANQTMLFVNLLTYTAVSVAFSFHPSSTVLAGAILLLFIPFFVCVAANLRQSQSTPPPPAAH